ncbi:MULTISPECIES: flavin reductase family protein [unclassified Mesorhizobium]|uniref:flavin reductase family protein n=1 Tax=unclassified Mesorhizobium TaxID=325217 RepID=UPI0007FF0E4F|nr:MULTISPECIES: flavin reductase family protein [unclassified Mesorhizobium]OBQ96608.1 hypothetical protein A9K66_21225 [Mesorhizobium sp. AA23]TIR58116.1 MAG: flavin reductase family protein [Mesorhizobium sp.]
MSLELQADAAIPTEPSPQPCLDPAMFRDMFSGPPSGVTVVTTLDETDVPVGLTVSAVMSASLAPPPLAVCPPNANHTLEAIPSRGAFPVNFLASSQSDVSDSFAFGNQDKFSAVAWGKSPHVEAPVLEDVRAHAECSVFRVIETGDHPIIVGRILSGAVTEDRPLTYCSRQHVDLVYKLAS